MRWALAIGLLCFAAPASAADQFDLLCNGDGEAQHYRIDLIRGEWCFGKCENVQRIASFTSGMITLAEHRPAYQGDSTSYNRVNRLTGEWTWYNFDPRYTAVMDIKGTCEPAPFSGFGTAAAKF